MLALYIDCIISRAFLIVILILFTIWLLCISMQNPILTIALLLCSYKLKTWFWRVNFFPQSSQTPIVFLSSREDNEWIWCHERFDEKWIRLRACRKYFHRFFQKPSVPFFPAPHCIPSSSSYMAQSVVVSRLVKSLVAFLSRGQQKTEVWDHNTPFASQKTRQGKGG